MRKGQGYSHSQQRILYMNGEIPRRRHAGLIAVGAFTQHWRARHVQASNASLCQTDVYQLPMSKRRFHTSGAAICSSLRMSPHTDAGTEMTDTNDTAAADVVGLASKIVRAFVRKNAVNVADLPTLISNVHSALTRLADAAPHAPAQPEPAVPIGKSITPDFIICLDDGKKFRSMKRHVGMLGMTPDEYRTKWGLPSDYPMVAPSYAAVRSGLAKSSGLGKKLITQASAASKETKAKAKRKA